MSNGKEWRATGHEDIAVNECQGRVALVTGASRGIGRAAAKRLAAEGAAVAITARSLDSETFGCSLRRSAEEIASSGGRVLPLEIDLADPTSDYEGLVQAIEDELGPVDILVNNAATGGFKRFAAWSDTELRTMQQINVWAPWQLTRLVIGGMSERGWGSIVNLTSMSAALPTGPPFPPGAVSYRGSAYGSTKAMLNRWTVSAAAEYEQHAVAVNAVAPLAAAATEAVLKSVELGQIPAEATEPIETMAEAILALSTADTRDGLTGQITTSLELIVRLQLPVRSLDGSHLVKGWQPADLEHRLGSK
jgi:citronellol/citronellal dehydrogenase